MTNEMVVVLVLVALSVHITPVPWLARWLAFIGMGLVIMLVHG